jgi:DUF4097 and DUF4098 domain-containing protein YvlB
MRNVFSTPEPVELYVEIGGGSVTVDAEDVNETTVDVEGPNADDVTVEQRGNQIVVIAPHRRGGFLGPSDDYRVTVTIPTDSELATKTGSADLVARGRYGSTKVKSGSGEVRIEEVAKDAVVDTGSGDIQIGRSHADVRVKSGSGDVTIANTGHSAAVSTGSGDVSLGTTEGSAVVKSGSGDVQVKEAHADVSITTASGDLTVGAIRNGGVLAKAVSGDVRIGVPAGIPVWTDISCVSGRVSSNLEGAGEPKDGQDFIEVRAKTVSGSIRLEQL